MESIVEDRSEPVRQDSRRIPPSTPRVSVVVPSYNHAKFIGRALESVAQQTYRDYEIILVDDASTDASAAVIEEFIACHPEIPCRFERHAINQGGVITLNDLIGLARCAYIALLNSDDIWLPDKLEQQVAYLDSHPEVGAVFTQALIVTDDGQVMAEAVDFSPTVFIQPNRSRGKWLRRLFYELNCLCHPSILIRKAVYNQVGLYDPRFRQLPDFQMWVRLIKQVEIHILETPLVHLRFHKTNTSKVTIEVSKRNLNELSFILNEFFDGMPADVFVDGFGDLFKKSGAEGDALACEQAFLFFTTDSAVKSLYTATGLRKLFYLLGSPETRRVLDQQYGFDYNAFFAMGGANFFDQYLVAFTRFEEPGSNDKKQQSIWRELFDVNIFYLREYLKKYPRVFVVFARTRKLFLRLFGKKKA